MTTEPLVAHYHNCGPESMKYLYWDHGWRFDMDDGNAGPFIPYCPFCGEKLNDD